MTVVKLAIRVAGGSGATYPFLPQLLFMQLEYKWGETGTPSSGWPMAYLLSLNCTMFYKTELFNTTTRSCQSCGKYLSTPHKSLKGLKSQYLKYIMILKNYHHIGSNNISREHILKAYIFLSEVNLIE